MKFLRLKIENFLTIGSAEVDLNDRGLILIQGQNTDDTSANSNGAGKSSIVDGLCWVLFGVTARGVTGDAVVNKTAKKNCSASVVIDDVTGVYHVTRHRKHKDNKNALIVHKVSGGPTRGTVDMTKGTDKETQEIVNGIIGCSYEVFTSSIYAGQEKMPDLPAMTDKFLKMLIEEAAGVQVLEKAHETAKRKLNEVKANLSHIHLQNEKSKSTLASTQAQFDMTSTRLKDFDDTKTDRVKAKLTEAEPLVRQLSDLKAKTAKVAGKMVELKDVRDNLSEKLRNAQSIAAKIDAAKEEWIKSTYAAKSLTDKVNMQRSRIQGIASEVKALGNLVGTGCKECGKEICAHDLSAAREAKVNQAKSVKEDVLTLQKQEAEAQEIQQTLKAQYESLELGRVNPAEYVEKISKIDQFLHQAKYDEETMAKLERDIAAIKTQAIAIRDQTNPYVKDLEFHKKSLEELQVLITDGEINELNASAEVDLHTEAVNIFGTSGVRAHILDTVTPYLNDRTHEYLGALADGNIHATWSTLTKSAKGDLKEKFSITVSNDKGAESFEGLSGGEKRKVRLATCMALQDLVASRATKPIQLFVGDEIDDALDSAGLERLMSLLERKARDRGTVLVISHNDLADYIDLAINVQKSGGYSTVSGDNLK
ncbi:AAA family ATPase [Acinetobacter brisouii]|uniref:AAA family ATPase n=1 Tax=Acinetobacter brisouii TaxID=396323 RepID=UPI00124F3C1F|nr:AAA family ATPase [Acinetobacter brisouii]